MIELGVEIEMLLLVEGRRFGVGVHSRLIVGNRYLVVASRDLEKVSFQVVGSMDLEKGLCCLLIQMRHSSLVCIHLVVGLEVVVASFEGCMSGLAREARIGNVVRHAWVRAVGSGTLGF